MRLTRNRILGGVGAAITATVAAVFMLGDSTISPGGDVQAALNAASCGDVITLEAGAVYPKPITLPVKPCTDTSYITIQSSRASELPEGKRVTPAQASLLAKLQSSENAATVIKTVAGAHHYKFIGIEVSTTAPTVAVYDLIRLGEGRESQKTLESVPHHIIIDRSYIHGWPTQDVQRGISLNSADTTISNSYISDIHGAGFDTQAIAGWNGTRNVKLINNHLEAAGENVLIGGADSATVDLIPRNVESRRNYLFKPLSWKIGHPTYAGRHWTIKNILELKSVVGFISEGDVLENNWTEAQDGKAILFTVRNQECSNPWATIQNVVVNHMTLRNSEGALNLLGKDNEAEPAYGKCPAGTGGSVRASGLTITNSLFIETNGTFLQMSGFDNVSLSNVTHLQKGNLTTFYGEPSQGFKYTKNLTIDHDYGIWTEAGVGVAGLAKFAPAALIEGNVIIAPYDKGAYPPNNNYSMSWTPTPDFRSPVAGIGANIDTLLAAQAGVISPLPSPTASASASPSVAPSIPPSPSPTSTAPLPSPTQPPPSPSPTLLPSPSPQPSPTPQTKVILYPKQPSRRNVILNDQWKLRYRLKSEGEGTAVFERVP